MDVLFDPPPVREPDPSLDEVIAWFHSRVPEPERFFGQLVRKGLDEVLDGPRTGRWDFDQLEKTEKTYVGTKLEILVRSALGLERGTLMDLEIAGYPVDIKWAMDSGWQIPEEAHGQICLCIGGRQHLTMFQVGLVRCLPEHLNLGRNKDQKTTLSVVGRAAMEWLVPLTALPQNFVASMDPEVRTRVMAEKSIQKRVTAMFRELPYVPIPRNAIRTVARTEGDPIRRTRADAGREDPLDGMKVLSHKYGNKIVARLGRPSLNPDEWMAVPLSDLAALPPEDRALLGLGDLG